MTRIVDLCLEKRQFSRRELYVCPQYMDILIQSEFLVAEQLYKRPRVSVCLCVCPKFLL